MKNDINENKALSQTSVMVSSKVCEGCLLCWNYLNEPSNCQGQEKEICHEFNDFNPFKSDL
jgi:hypothetical protein